MIWKSLITSTCPVNLSMWMYFFKDRNPNSTMVMNAETGEYFIVNNGLIQQD